MNSRKLSVDECEIDFEELRRIFPADGDDMILTYLFRGWYLTEIVHGEIPTIDKCPCCFRPWKNEKLNNKDML